ncbi:hypothetical protein BC833DRAFT_609341 [Globomyces pollinis-pini]|nr:hypothetical protein BC833DRAFT_609341 [Globomyces pollinis-pini]
MPKANVYFFRNMITNKVLVSPRFRMENSILNQTGEHRNQLKIRPDHYVPFCVITGLNPRIVDPLIKKCTTVFKQPISKKLFKFPVQHKSSWHSQFSGWKIPDEVKVKTIALCKFLNKKSAEVDDLDIQLHWERDEYQFIPDEEKLVWPTYIQHQKLILQRNRYPDVPGFNTKRRDDIYHHPIATKPKPTPLTPESFWSNKSTWKVKNKVPETGSASVHRYGSKFGKSFPILKKTEFTSRFAKLRALKNQSE